MFSANIHWRLNNVFDFEAAYQIVRDFTAAAQFRLSDETFITLGDSLCVAVKGDNPIDGPSYRWPDAAAYGELVRMRVVTLPTTPTAEDLHNIILAPGIATPIDKAQIEGIQGNLWQIGETAVSELLAHNALYAGINS
jgi:hypothetical protein